MIPLAGQFVGRRVPLHPPQVTVGRAPDAMISIPSDSGLSRLHARFALVRGVWTVEDLGSTNGTKLNGQQIGGIVPLAIGDVVEFGAQAWRFEQSDPTLAAQTHAATTPTLQFHAQRPTSVPSKRPAPWITASIAFAVIALVVIGSQIGGQSGKASEVTAKRWRLVRRVVNGHAWGQEIDYTSFLLKSDYTGIFYWQAYPVGAPEPLLSAPFKVTFLDDDQLRLTFTGESVETRSIAESAVGSALFGPPLTLSSPTPDEMDLSYDIGDVNHFTYQFKTDVNPR